MAHATAIMLAITVGNMVLAMLAGLAVAVLSDRVGRKPVLISSPSACASPR